MSQSIQQLKQKRAVVKGQVTRILNSFNAGEAISREEAQVRLEKLKGLWDKFDEIQTNIDIGPDGSEEELSQRTLDGDAERQVFETCYYQAAGKAQSILREYEQQERERQRAAELRRRVELPEHEAEQRQPQQRRVRPKLPQLQLQEFSGDYTKWMFFKNSFEVSIDRDEDLTPMDKHQYLVGQLRGEALQAVQGFSITETSYASAWQLLKDTYDNQVMIIETHLDELLDFPVISKDNKAESVRQLIWHIQTHYKSLEALRQPVRHWETIIIHLAKKKLDFTEQRDWQEKVKDKTPETMPGLDEFLKFLTDRCHALRLLKQQKPKSASEKPGQKKQPERSEKKIFVATDSSPGCKICEGDHPVFKCEEFLKKSIPDRLLEVKEKQLCINCFATGHYMKNCRASTCKKCSGRHNTLLHREAESSEASGHSGSETPVVSLCAEPQGASGSASTDNEDFRGVFHLQPSTSSIILSTAKIIAYDRHGNQQICRALLDPGSQSNLITEQLARRLHLQFRSSERAISGINRAKTLASKVVDLRVKSTHNEFATTMECLVLDTITERLPQQKIDARKIIMPKDISLADPEFDEPGKIDLLIGAGVFWRILIGSQRNRIEGQPALQNTQFGWILGGELHSATRESATACLAVTDEALDSQIERFWRQEDFPETQHFTDEERACEKNFIETLRRDSSGRFVVRLPKRENVALGDSKDQAVRRLFTLERRLAKNAALRLEYDKFMDDYIEQGHMSKVHDEDGSIRESYVLPQQVIIRPDSVTTKLRVVFDASARTTFGTSLNDKLMAGPNLQRELFDIVLRFRAHEYVITGDVAMMFRQILVDKSDRPLQRILWRRRVDEPVELFELNTVTYGTSCAPYLAIRCLRQLALENGEDLPHAARAILEDCYMDDVLTGASSINETIQLQQELSQMLKRGQFHLRKWRTNDRRVLQHLEEESKTDNLLKLDKDGPLKTLGLLWNATTDCLQYQIDIKPDRTITKRLVLSKIAQVFDPLGLIAPVLIVGKIIMQRLWGQEIDWDQPIPQEIFSVWDEYYAALPRIGELKITRNITPANQSKKFDVFGFGDASEKAYGACLYAVSMDDGGEIHAHLICAKSKVAPLKTISLPRLELEAALLLSRLVVSVSRAYGEKIGKIKLWSDSTIVLGWIKTPPHTLKTFVANRVSKIQERSRETAWFHVPSEDNPADLISRGVGVDALATSKLWWHGPSWLVHKHQWPDGMQDPETELPERKSTSVTLAAVDQNRVLPDCATYGKLQRVVAYCHRFKSNALGTKSVGELTVEELERAEKTILRLVQREEFAEEMRALETNRELASKSKLRALDPFIDEDGIIRVGGRLRHASISTNQKHPIVLPSRHRVTSLIMRSEHMRLHHCPPEQLLCAVRHRYWPISGRREARKIVNGCLSCFRFRPTNYDVKMGDLPQQRVTGFERPFTRTGVDYAGPIQVRESRRRGRVNVTKGYIAVFTCFSTRAVHLELVSDLTSEAFLAALSRFTARRGICSEMFSDNGTNFVGAARELREVYDLLQREKGVIAANLAKQKIVWKFIPPRAPHFGGIWEATVKITKRHLNTVTRGRVLTYEEYSTLLAEIEAIINSRPLTPLSGDPADLSVLTPSHFLIGDSLVQPVQPNFSNVSENRLSKWQLLQKLRQQFWDRWQSEYLQELQRRNKWTTPGNNIRINTLVLLKEDHVPPLQWVLGRVSAVFPGPDGVVRVVSVKTPSGEFKRAVQKLCPIPVDGELND